MEDAFIELYQQFRKLQAVCFQQRKLLQRLTKNIPTTEMPISKPIQCTDAGDPTCSESPFFWLKAIEVLSADTAKTRSEEPSQPLETEANSSFSFDFDIQFPPKKEESTFLANQAVERELAIGMSKSGVGLEKSEMNANVASLFLNKYASTILNQDFLPVDPDHNLSFSNIYDELCFLQPKDKSKGDLFEPQPSIPSGVRGPVQSLWSPGCLSDECQLFHHDDNNSDVGFSSQICEFCQAVFPAGAATKSEYLQHISEHIE